MSKIGSGEFTIHEERQVRDTKLMCALNNLHSCHDVSCLLVAGFRICFLVLMSCLIVYPNRAYQDNCLRDF